MSKKCCAPVIINLGEGEISPGPGVDIAAGSYSPTFSDHQNAATVGSLQFMWTRIENIVTVSGKFVANSPDTSQGSRVNFNLPIPADLSGFDHAGAVSASGGSGGGMVVCSGGMVFLIDDSTGQILWTPPGLGTNTNVGFTYRYMAA